MKYRCRDCGYESNDDKALGPKCSQCGSLYIFPVEKQTTKFVIPAKHSATARWKAQYEKYEKNVRLLGFVIVISLLSGVWYLYEMCQESDSGGCPQFGRMLLGVVRMSSQFFK
jgi:DNA-directed RNA polymerase subunit RPC12/RpoP